MVNRENSKIAIIGLGYVGLPLAMEFGKIYSTLGFDINKKRINELNKGNDVTLEITSEQFHLASHLHFSHQLEDLKQCNVFIVTVPTPIDKANRPDLSPLKAASTTVAQILKKGDTVIYESTVYPGCTEEVCVPILEDISKLTFNQDFFCGYSPERINPGDKEMTITKIKKITSGSTPESSEYIDHLYKSIITAGTYQATNIKVAEAAKVIENTQRDINIALINELSIIFERLGIDTQEVLNAAGSKWNFLRFNPGIVGGHCIGVDPYYLTHKAEQVGYNPAIILAGRRINDDMAPYIAQKFIQRMVQNNIDVTKSKIGILGITFKENCPDIRNSKVIDMIEALRKWNIDIIVSDPWANPEEVKQQYGIELTDIDANNPVDSLIVAVGHGEYREYQIKDLKNYCRGKTPVIADIKSLYDRHQLVNEGFNVFRL